MDRSEPMLAPEWLKAGGSSSHSDEHHTGTLSRNRQAVSACDHDAPRALSSSSSFRRSVSSNCSTSHDKDSYAHSRVYSSFGRSRRDRDRDRQRDREKDNLLDNGFCDYADSLMTRRADKDNLRRSQSMVPGRRVESLTKSSGNDSSSGAHSVGSSGSSLSKVSFERDFPSLGAEEKLGISDVGRALSPAIDSLHISTPAIIGTDGWASALAEVPAAGVRNASLTPSALQTATNFVSTASSSATGLSMAETLVQGPARARTAPLLSTDNERRKELTLMQQYNKLIPVLNSSEKSKPKGARNGDLVAPKVTQQPSTVKTSQATKPDIVKTSQAGNFLVLNWEKNTALPITTKDGSPVTTASRVMSSLGGVPSASNPVTTASRVASSLGGVPSASNPHLKSPSNPKLKINGIGGEKKPLSQVQDRNDFFNSLRKKAEMKNGTLHNHPPPELGRGALSSSPVSSISNSMTKSTEKNLLASLGTDLVSSMAENGNSNACDEEAETLVAPDQEEKAFLESLGWNENTGEGALTAEEIESFVKKHEEKLGPDFKYKAGLPVSRRSGSCSSGLSLSNSEAES